MSHLASGCEALLIKHNYISNITWQNWTALMIKINLKSHFPNNSAIWTPHQSITLLTYLEGQKHQRLPFHVKWIDAVRLKIFGNKLLTNNALQHKGRGVIQELFVRWDPKFTEGKLLSKSASLVPRLYLSNVILLLSLAKQMLCWQHIYLSFPL